MLMILLYVDFKARRFVVSSHNSLSNLLVFFFCMTHLNASKPSEHPPHQGETIETFRWENELQTPTRDFLGFPNGLAKINGTGIYFYTGIVILLPLIFDSIRSPSSLSRVRPINLVGCDRRQQQSKQRV